MNFERKENILFANLQICAQHLHEVEHKFNFGDINKSPAKLFENLSNNYWNRESKTKLNQIINFDKHQEPDQKQLIYLNRNNHYAYFQKMLQLVDSPENQDIINSINESITDIDSFDNFDTIDVIELRGLLRNVSAKLAGINDFNNLRKLNTIAQQTKLFTKQQINVFGLNIMDIENIVSNKMLNESEICYVCYENSNKQIFFLPKKTKATVNIYDIKTDFLGDYNYFVNTIVPIEERPYYSTIPTGISIENNVIKELSNILGVNLFLITTLSNNLGLQFSDNLFNIKKRKDNYNKKHSKFHKSGMNFIK